jgi:rubrerythrin
MLLSKATALRLASYATHEGATALRGCLKQAENGQFMVGDRNLSEWLSHHEGVELMVILAAMDSEPHAQVRQCGICGRDFEGAECPHCASARARLRGR